jgi:hypothetical protein
MKIGGHLGFGGHFEFCDDIFFYAGNIVLISWMFVCNSVLIRLTHSTLLPKWIVKTPILIKIGGHLGFGAYMFVAFFIWPEFSGVTFLIGPIFFQSGPNFPARLFQLARFFSECIFKIARIFRRAFFNWPDL